MARHLVLADVHSNLEALDTVLRDARNLTGGFDDVWVVGDIVGYGPFPGECISRLKQVDALCVAGNHDLGVVGRLDLTWFNPEAAEACKWTAAHVSTEDRDFLVGLPESRILGSFLMVHGSPRDPSREYVTSVRQANALAAYCQSTHCLVGHTHCPAAFGLDVPVSHPVCDGAVVNLRGGRLVLNPGAVGQPRDGDPRAAYGMLDENSLTFEFHRVEYDVTATSSAVLREGLPKALAMRLHCGN